MITVSFNNKPFQASDSSPDHSLPFISGIVNWHLSTISSVWRPPTDVFETDENVVIRVDIAGVKESDFSITLDQNVISIRGMRSDISEKRAYHQLEIPFGEFHTEIKLPVAVDTDRAQAEYKNGFLWVSIPKSHTKHIDITKK